MTTWEKVLEQFTGGYGGPPDFEDKGDVALFMGLLETEVRREIEKGLAAQLAATTARFKKNVEAIGVETPRAI